MNINTQIKGNTAAGNDVCIVKLNGIQLPLDVLISINGSKIIAQSQILDGVAVFERVSRKPYDIDLDFVLRGVTKEKPKGLIPGLKINKPDITKWSFPLKDSEDEGVYYPGIITLLGYCWEENRVLKIENSFLNAINIQQVVVSDVQIGTQRGSINVPIKLKCIEDFYSTKTQGTTLIIQK